MKRAVLVSGSAAWYLDLHPMWVILDPQGRSFIMTYYEAIKKMLIAFDLRLRMVRMAEEKGFRQRLVAPAQRARGLTNG